jgi:CheY-like chemotaxis protein
MKKLNCIMLIDDNPDDNFFHERVIRKSDAANIVLTKTAAKEALEYLKQKGQPDFVHPDLIFLDINMPGMNGWDFLEEFQKLDESLRSAIIVIMLTTSENPDDKEKAMKLSLIYGFRSKPLTRQMLEEIIEDSF